MTVAFVNAIAFVLTKTDKNEENNTRRIVSMFGSGFTALVGGVRATRSVVLAYQVARQATSRPAIEKFLAFTKKYVDSTKATGAMGVVGAVTSLWCGGLTAWEGFADPDEKNRDVAKGISGVLQMAGGLGLGIVTGAILCGVVPYAAPLVVVEIGSSLCLVASTVAASWNDLKALRLPGTQTVFTYHLNAFGASSEFKLVAASSPELKTAYTDVLTSLERAHFKPLLLADGETFSSMRLSGMFGAADVEQMYVETVHFPPNFSQDKARET